MPLEAASFDLALSRLALHHMSDPRRAIQQMARALRPGGRLALFDMITSEVTEESAYHNLVERLRDPSHTRALPPSELFHYAGLAGLVADRLETIDYDIDVDDWIARADQPAEDARKTRELLADAIGTRRFGGRRVWRDDTGKLWFTVRGAIVCATKPAPG